MALLTRIYFNAVFGALGGLLGWMLFGVFANRVQLADDSKPVFWLALLLAGALIGGAVGYFVVGVEALRDRSLLRFVRLASYGVGLGRWAARSASSSANGSISGLSSSSSA